MTEPGSASGDLAALLDRRAALRRARRSDPTVEAELVAATAAVQARAFDRVPPVVRALSPTGERALIARLLDDEAVHPVAPADRPAAVADRSASDRRVLVLEHPEVPGRPFHVVWVALARGVPGTMDEVIGEDRPRLAPTEADTAVFWSIWGVEPGIEGMGAGVQLIVGALDLLRAELRGLATFVTLSPVPGFRAWQEARPPAATDERSRLRDCARYLTTIGTSSAPAAGARAGRPLDPVARFHLGNGARLWRLNPRADPSSRGEARSFGIMANYRYDPEDRDANRASLRDGQVVTSAAVDELLA